MARQLPELDELLGNYLADDDLILVRDMSAKQDKRLSIGDLAEFVLGGFDTSKMIEFENKNELPDGSYLIKKANNQFTCVPYVEPEDNVKLLFAEDGDQTSGVIGSKTFTIPINSLVWENGKCKYSKLEIDIQFESTSDGAWKIVYAYGNNGNTLDTSQAGAEVSGTSLSGQARTGQQVIAAGVYANQSVLYKIEMFPNLSTNWVAYIANGFGGVPTGNNKSQDFFGRINASVNNIKELRLNEIANVQKTYRVRLWGYK